jgi:hypothetical protein
MYVNGWGYLPVICIGDQAFSGCESMTNVTIGTNVTSIGYETFDDCISLKSIAIPNSVTNIGDYAFGQCTSLTNITISTNVTSIANFEFWDCTSLPNVTIPNGVTSIGYDAFFFCPKLTSVPIPNSVANIGEAAFVASGLTSVTIPQNVTSIGHVAFGQCASLPAITVDINNPVYSSLNGILFDKNLTTLIQYPAGKTGISYTVPASVTSIGADAFDYCTNLTNVMIGTSVTSIGDQAFYCCTNLTSVYFQGNTPTPSNDLPVFYADNNATIYYLPGTTGWVSTFDGRPVALWLLPNPLILNYEPNFGMQTNGFGFIISWATNIAVVVEATTNLTNPVWQPVQTNTLASGSSYFSDSQRTNYPARFYRLRSP